MNGGLVGGARDGPTARAPETGNTGLGPPIAVGGGGRDVGAFGLYCLYITSCSGLKDSATGCCALLAAISDCRPPDSAPGGDTLAAEAAAGAGERAGAGCTGGEKAPNESELRGALNASEAPILADGTTGASNGPVLTFPIGPEGRGSLKKFELAVPVGASNGPILVATAAFPEGPSFAGSVGAGFGC